MQPLGALVGCERVHALAQSGHVTAEHPRRPPRALCHHLAPQLRRMLPPVRPAVMEGRDGRIPLAAQPLGGAPGQGARPEDVRTIAWGIPPRFGRRCQVSCDDCGGGLCAQGVLLCHKALDHLLHVLEEIPESGDLEWSKNLCGPMKIFSQEPTEPYSTMKGMTTPLAWLATSLSRP